MIVSGVLLVLCVPMLFIGIFLLLGTRADRKRAERDIEWRVNENRKMFEAQMRGELYIPQAGG